MTSEEFKSIRKARGETEIEFARALGYTGSDSTVNRLIRRIEAGTKEISPSKAIRAIQLRYARVAKDGT